MSVAINHFLNPIMYYLDQEDVSEICINQPGEVFIEKRGTFERCLDDSLTLPNLMAAADLVAEFNNKTISKTKPLLSATLPTGERCQFVLPGALEHGQFGVSIRKPSRLNLSIDDWVNQGFFSKLNEEQQKSNANEYLKKLYDKACKGDEIACGCFLKEAVKQRKNIVISGGTSTAKTTFLKSFLFEIPEKERIITIEGVREVTLPHKNKLHLLANEDEDNPNTTSMLDLLKSCLRLRPDRIFLSELRSKEAYPFLRACISGHPGSMTTMHADSIESAKEQLSFMLCESPELKGASEVRLKSLINASIDVFIQVERIGGSRFARAIEYKDRG